MHYLSWVLGWLAHCAMAHIVWVFSIVPFFDVVSSLLDIYIVFVACHTAGVKYCPGGSGNIAPCIFFPLGAFNHSTK